MDIFIHSYTTALFFCLILPCGFGRVAAHVLLFVQHKHTRTAHYTLCCCRQSCKASSHHNHRRLPCGCCFACQHHMSVWRETEGETEGEGGRRNGPVCLRACLWMCLCVFVKDHAREFFFSCLLCVCVCVCANVRYSKPKLPIFSNKAHPLRGNSSGSSSSNDILPSAPPAACANIALGKNNSTHATHKVESIAFKKMLIKSFSVCMAARALCVV